MPSDIQLLRRYAEEKSEAAFNELVRRHIDLVYSCALRWVRNDEPLAKEVAQNVFTDLARKSLQICNRTREEASPASEDESNPTLSGWLYSSTRYAAANAVRSEQTRRRREQEACTMNLLLDPGCPDFNGSELRPVLDEAMSRLAEADRDAVVLRFFEGNDLRSVGAALGLSEDAARMRVNRALEKLRGLLAARGMTTTFAVLSLALSACAAQAAPAGLAASMAKASLAATAVLPSATSTMKVTLLMTSMKMKAGLAILAAAALVGSLSIQTHRRQAAEKAERQQQQGQQILAIIQQHAIKLIVFAGNNGDRLPGALQEIGVSDADFELLPIGSLSATPKPGSSMILRERKPWKTASGDWARAYAFADGHSEVGIQKTPDFSQWEMDKQAGRPTR